MKIKTQFSTMLAVAGLALFAVALVGFIKMEEAQSSMSEVGDNRTPKMIYLLDLESSLHQVRAAAYAISSKSDTTPREKQLSEVRDLVDAYNKALNDVKKDFAAYAALPRVNPEMSKKWDELASVWKDYIPLLESIPQNVTNTIASNPSQEALDKMFTQDVDQVLAKAVVYRTSVLDTLSWLVDKNKEMTLSLVADSKGSLKNSVRAQVTVSVVAIVLVIVMGLFTMKAIFFPINKLSTSMLETAKNRDLRLRVDYKKNNEIGEVVEHFNELMGGLQNSLKEITNLVVETTQGVEVLNTAAQQVATSSASQASSTSAMAASVEEMSVSVNTVSSSAEDAQNIAQEAGRTSAEGGEIIERTAAEMVAISGVVGKASEVIQTLGEESKQISSVVQVIKEVADQTNLLALNAAIEAARAGEQGRGFAVVADEVRKLAERTTQSTIDISTMIGKIQVSAKEAVDEMDQVVQQVESGQALAREAGERIVSIREGANKVSEAVTEISNALKEQTQASQEIAKHVENIAQMTDENNAAAEETASSAAHLNQLAASVKKTVEQFKV